MKKFSNVVEMVREANQQELSDLQKSYREYFGAKLKKFDAESPADLTDDQKKEFFNEIKKDWEKGSGAKPAGKKDVEEHGVKESQELNEDVTTPEGLALFIQQQEKHFATFLKPKTLTVAVSGKVVTIKPGSGSFTITVDYSKSTIDTTGKPAWPESTSYVELMEYIKKTKFKLNESEDVNESVLAIAGGIILGALGLNVIAKIFKSVSAGVSLMRVTDPGKMKEIASQISSELITNKGINPLKAVLWQQTVEGMIDKGDIKNAYELAKTIKGINDIDLKNVFEEEGFDMSDIVSEAEITEGDIKSKEDFAKFAKDKLKKVHGDDFDEEKAQKVIDGLSKDAEKDDNWGAAVGKLNKA